MQTDGVWTLLIRDDLWLFSGILNSWSIDFTCEAECEEGEELYTLNLFDSYGDGWDHGSGHLVTINGVDYGGYDFTTGTSFSLHDLFRSNRLFRFFIYRRWSLGI